MKTLLVLWLAVPTGFMGWLVMRDWLRQRAIVRDHCEALREDAARLDAQIEKRIRDWKRANERFLKDLGLKVATPRVVESKEGVWVRASCEAEAAEILWAKYLKIERVA
jgi:hypothetical protein